MKPLFKENLQLNEDGLRLSLSFSEMLKTYLAGAAGVNPIELYWLVNNEIEVNFSRLYLEAAEISA